MTLPALPGSFRPGGATTPQAQAQALFVERALEAHLKFLTAEERATATLMGFFEEARLDLEGFIREGDLSVSDATFYRQLLDETNRLATKANALGAEWTSSTIPEAYSSGWRTWSSTVVPLGALEALSRSTLSLITQTSEGMRLAVRQSIAAGILEGLPGDEVRARILATGLTNIPHWPSVEYRAGVIARTETMAAYNGGAIDGIVANGARFARWITSPDEAVCPICLPREGHVYRVGPTDDTPNDPYPSALPLPKLPAHPRCRCTVRAEYRDANGQVIRATAPETPPGLPDDAMGGQDEPTVPPAVGDLRKAIGGLPGEPEIRRLVYEAEHMSTLNPGLGIDDERMLSIKRAAQERLGTLRAFWRQAEFDEAALRQIAGYEGGTLKAAKERMGALFLLRYGISFATDGAWTKGSMLASLHAIELLRKAAPRWVIDSSFLTHWGSAPAGAKRMSGSRAAEMYATCHMRPNYSAMKKYVDMIDGYGVGVDDTLLEVLVHELGHSVHNRYGAHAGIGYQAVEIGGDVFERVAYTRQFEDEWTALRRATEGRVAATTKQLSGAVDDLKRRLATWEAREAESPGGWTGIVASLKKQLAEAEKLAATGPVGEYYPTDYARRGGYKEDFAESFMLYLLNPTRLREWSPGRYDFMRRRIFA